MAPSSALWDVGRNRSGTGLQHRVSGFDSPPSLQCRFKDLYSQNPYEPIFPDAR